MPINIFTAENTEGRIDVARALASAETAMYIYDLSPGEVQSPRRRSPLGDRLGEGVNIPVGTPLVRSVLRFERKTNGEAEP